MYSTIKTAVLEGIHTHPIQVEVDISNGMPSFDMVGHLSPEVREGKERVRTALHSLGILLPAKRITINLSPANIKKSGTGFDLPIAIAILLSLGLITEDVCKETLFIGELSLNGCILPVKGILPVVSDGMEQGIRKFIISKENEKEALLVQSAEVFAFSNLQELLDYLNGTPYEKNQYNIVETELETKMDFSDVNGQQFLKRACEIAASGMHNILLVGPPRTGKGNSGVPDQRRPGDGCPFERERHPKGGHHGHRRHDPLRDFPPGAGKTMISERMSTILPPLTEEECLELSKIYSVCGLLGQGRLIRQRPFRSPHHTITKVGLSGGGAIPKPGEISLAHNGVLFLDELPEFQKNTLEILRQPLEDHQIHLVRSGGEATYPANFLLLASMNPCNCGYYPDMQRCRCTPSGLRRYFERISQPLIDRIDICVEAQALSYKELTGKGKGESSLDIQRRVRACYEIQCERFQKEAFTHNSQIPAARLEEYCWLGEKESRYMETMYEKMSLTGRTYHKILRVARTIADMEQEKDIKLKHLNEAICYRSIDGKYWGGDIS